MNKTVPILILLGLFGVATVYFFLQPVETVDELPVPQLLPAEPIAAQQAEPVQDVLLPEESEVEAVVISEPLPVLYESDPEVSAAMAQIVGADPLAQFLVKGEIISRMVATIDALTSRQVPPQINPIRPVEGNFAAVNDGDRVTMSAENFRRYDAYIALLDAIDAVALLAFYDRYFPLFQQAYEENGGEQDFDQRLREVIDDLLDTPDVPGPIYVSKPEAVYLFEQDELESMSAGQKILVRMGSANAAVVKEKLLEIRQGLDGG